MRQSCAAYLASFLSRARFVLQSTLRSALLLLRDWLLWYMDTHDVVSAAQREAAEEARLLQLQQIKLQAPANATPFHVAPRANRGFCRSTGPGCGPESVTAGLDLPWLDTRSTVPASQSVFRPAKTSTSSSMACVGSGGEPGEAESPDARYQKHLVTVRVGLAKVILF